MNHQKSPLENAISKIKQFEKIYDSVEIKFVGKKNTDTFILPLSLIISPLTNGKAKSKIIFENQTILVAHEIVELTTEDLIKIVKGFGKKNFYIGTRKFRLTNFSDFDFGTSHGGRRGPMDVDWNWPYFWLRAYGKNAIGNLIDLDNINSKLNQIGYQNLGKMCEEKLGFSIYSSNNPFIHFNSPIYIGTNATIKNNNLIVCLNCHTSISIDDLKISFGSEDKPPIHDFFTYSFADRYKKKKNNFIEFEKEMSMPSETSGIRIWTYYYEELISEDWISPTPPKKVNGFADKEKTKRMNKFDKFDRKYMQLAIAEMKKSRSEHHNKLDPMVGAILIDAEGNELGRTYRGSLRVGDHAEYTLLERILRDINLEGSTLYVTLEPCTTRKHPKISCAERIVLARIKKIFIGMFDPNPEIRGKGVELLLKNNIDINFFHLDLIRQIETENMEFISQFNLLTEKDKTEVKLLWSKLESSITHVEGTSRRTDHFENDKNEIDSGLVCVTIIRVANDGNKSAEECRGWLDFKGIEYPLPWAIPNKNKSRDIITIHPGESQPLEICGWMPNGYYRIIPTEHGWPNPPKQVGIELDGVLKAKIKVTCKNAKPLGPSIIKIKRITEIKESCLEPLVEFESG